MANLSPLDLCVQSPPNTQPTYASFTTMFLTPVEIEVHWNDSPIIINGDTISDSTPEDEFSEAMQRVWVTTNFKDRVRKASVINYLGRNSSDYKYFATYSHLMDDKDAYIRVVAYHRSGRRVDGKDPTFGHWILVIPRRLNDVCFPSQLRFYALQATDDRQYPLEEHHNIIDAAKRNMSFFDKIAWEHIYIANHQTC